MITDGARPSLRERKKAQTRAVVYQTALQMFAERGYEATTIEAICRESMTSPSTFARYFGSKAAVLFANHAELLQLFADTIESQLHRGSSLEQALRAAAIEVNARQLSDEYHAVYLDLIEHEPALALHHTKLLREYETLIADAISRYTSIRRDDLRVKVYAAAINAALGVTTQSTSDAPRRGDVHEQALRAVDTAFTILIDEIGSVLGAEAERPPLSRAASN